VLEVIGRFQPGQLVLQLQLATLQLGYLQLVRGRMDDGTLNLTLESLMLALKFGQVILKRHVRRLL
jgi:hypothetical protein